MNIMSKVTLRQMRINRRRTIVTIIGVIISVAMFTAVSTLGGSFLNFMQEAVILSTGDYHMRYEDITADGFRLLQSDKNTDSAYAVRQEWAQLPDQSGDMRFIALSGVSTDKMEQAGVKLLEGRLPANNTELVIQKNMRDENGKDYRIGDRITLSVGERVLIEPEERGDGELHTDLRYQEGYREGEEMFRVTEQRTYTIVGFAAMTPLGDSYLASNVVVTAIRPEITAGTFHAYVKMKTLDSSIYDRSEELAEQIGATGARANTSLLLYTGVNSDDGFMRMIYTLVGILFTIIFIGSVALIYNAFAISVTERSANFGLLASVGATRRQKRLAVFFEAFVIELIAIPLGVIGGIFGMQAVFWTVNPTIASMLADEFESAPISLQVIVSPYSILIAVVLSIVTVFVSAWIPALRASRITPMEAIRQTKDVKLTPRSVKTSWLTRKLFGFSGEIAVKNMKRNKKRYRIAISSFVISLVLFLAAGSFTHFLTNSSRMALEPANYDITVWADRWTIGDPSVQKLQTQLIEDIRQTDGVTAVTAVQHWSCLSAENETAYTPLMQAFIREGGDEAMAVNFIALDDVSLREYCKKVGADYDAMQDSSKPCGIIINDVIYQNGHNFTECSVYALQAGETLQFATFGGETGELQVEALTGELPMGLERTRYRYNLWVDVIVSQKTQNAYYQQLMKEAHGGNQFIYLTADDPSAVTKRMGELAKDSKYSDLAICVYDMSSNYRLIQQELFLINTFSYVFIGLISAIGVANIFNTISTSILLRKREFAMLKSVGMTPRAFNRMLYFESLLYGLKSLLWGLPISFGLMFLIYRVLLEYFDMAFTVPWVHVVIGIGAIFLIVSSTMLYSARKVKKENIIDALRGTNL